MSSSPGSHSALQISATCECAPDCHETRGGLDSALCGVEPGEVPGVMTRLAFGSVSAAATAIVLLVPDLACSQGFPSRPLRLIVASAPGGSPDINARELANELTKQLGQQV